MAYSEKVLDHYENPRNVGSFAKEAGDVGTGMVGAPACGDVMKLQIRVGADGVIEDAKFKTYGCGSAIASSSLVTEWVKGKTLDQAMSIKNTEIAQELALPLARIGEAARDDPLQLRQRPLARAEPGVRSGRDLIHVATRANSDPSSPCGSAAVPSVNTLYVPAPRREIGHFPGV
jgi:nitrogen fixation NifU-like protein